MFNPVITSLWVSIDSVAVGVFVHRDLVGTGYSLRRRVGNFVKDGAQVLVKADHFQAGRVLVLAIVDNPHSTPRVPREKQWL